MAPLGTRWDAFLLKAAGAVGGDLPAVPAAGGGQALRGPSPGSGVSLPSGFWAILTAPRRQDTWCDLRRRERMSAEEDLHLLRDLLSCQKCANTSPSALDRNSQAPNS